MILVALVQRERKFSEESSSSSDLASGKPCRAAVIRLMDKKNRRSLAENDASEMKERNGTASVEHFQQEGYNALT